MKAIRIAGWGHAAFALTMIGFGVLGLIKGEFTPIWGGVPAHFPGRVALVYICACVTLATGIGLLLQRWAAVASRVLFVYFAAWMLLLRLPMMFIAFAVDTWWAAGQAAVFVGAAWVPYVWFAGKSDGQLKIARALYGAGLIPFGIAHFLYLERTASLVPGWLPWHVGLSYATGAAFIAAGVAMLTGVYARLAAALSALQMGLFTVLVWVPIILGPTPKPSDWQEFIASIALTAAGWIVADSYRGTPWLAVGKR